MKKGLKIFVAILILIVIVTLVIAMMHKNEAELKTIESKKELLRIYQGEDTELKEKLIRIIAMPFSLFYYDSYLDYDMKSSGTITSGLTSSVDSSKNYSTSSKEYSTTNIQVENVDEADIIKTDGNYIYSISENDVIITDVRNPNEPKIAATIKSNDNDVPEDMILYKDKLVVISTVVSQTNMLYYYDSKTNTMVKIYNITSRENPVLTKSYEMYQPYYTSRCIDNTLYVISSGSLRKEDDEVVVAYKEDNTEKELSVDKIKYLKDVKTQKQTLISIVDLNNETAEVKLDSYLMSISNAYVSKNAIYLLNEKRKYNTIGIWALFGIKGVFGIVDGNRNNSGYYTEIYKFDMNKNGDVNYKTKAKLNGETINQYSLDEKDGHLRIALYGDKGSRIAILDENLKQIGESENVAKGEKMYSSRFIGDKVYFVTYKTVDPLFVMDLSDETNPKVLGKLKIPGYSTYLHPYDENYIIGIGMETKETINRNSSGRVISTTTKIVGMKMALFNVSNVSNPIQVSSVVIGDSRTTSAILTNPKALLFSKEKSLIAIPVNNYKENFEITASNNYEIMTRNYLKYSKPYIAEGYFVYNINVQDGFKLKGVITHEKAKATYYYSNSKLLRGLYIDNNLYTVSETAIKVNDLETLKLVSELKLKDTESETKQQPSSQGTDKVEIIDENIENIITNIIEGGI